MDRKKELKMQYKQMKPQMGIFMIRSHCSNKFYIEATQDLRGKINSDKFKLCAGGHPNYELQKEWNDFGAENFTIEILEHLAYEDDSKTNYKDDLDLLKMIWEDKLAIDNMECYKK